MNKWRLLLLSIFALLHITTSERDFFDGRYGCYALSPRYLPSDTSFSAYETNRELRFSPQIRQLNSPEKYPTFNVRDPEIVRLSRRQIRDIKHHTRDNEIREAVRGERNRILTSPSNHIRDKREDFTENSYERGNDLRNNLRRNRLVRYRDTEYQRNIRTASPSRDDYRKKYATSTRFENRDVSRYNNNDRDMRNAHNNNREARRKFPEYDTINTRRNINRNDMRNGFNYIRYTETYGRDIHEEPDLSNLRTKRSARSDDNDKLSNDRKSRLGIQRDLYEDHSQRESRNGRRNNVRSLDRIHLRKTNIRSLVRDSPFDQVDIHGERENRLRTKRSSSEEAYLLREDHNNAISQIDKRNRNYNARSTRDKTEKRTLENRQARNNVGPKMNRVNMKTRLEANEREVHVSRYDRANVNYNARSTRDAMEKRTSENRNVRDNGGSRMNRVNLITRLDMKEREKSVSRFDSRNINYNASSTRDTIEKRTLENRRTRNNVGLKMNRINMNTRLEANERKSHVSRFDRDNVNYNARSTRDAMEKRTSENRDVRDNGGPKMNRVNLNTRLDVKEREKSVSRSDRRIVNYNARNTRDTREKRTLENRQARNNVGPKINRVNMKTRLEANEHQGHVFIFDSDNVNYNVRSTRDTMEKRTSEKSYVRDNVAPRMNRVNMNARFEMKACETPESRFDRRNVNYNGKYNRDTTEKRTSENREIRDNNGPKIIRVNMNTRLESNEREAHMSRFDMDNVNYNSKSTRDAMEKRTSENRNVRDNGGPKINRVNLNTRLDVKERETSVSRSDRRNVNYNARNTREINEKETLENREARNNVRPPINRVNINTRLEMKERQALESRFDRRNVNYNTRSSKDTIEKRTLENRQARNNVESKINRVSMKTRLEANERQGHVSRFDRDNVNYNVRSTSNTMEKRTSEKSYVRDNVAPRMNRVNMNARLEMKARETPESRFDRRNENYNGRYIRDTMEKQTSENREIRDHDGLKMNRVHMNTRLGIREREAPVSRFDRSNINYNARAPRATNEKEMSENREIGDNVGPKTNRINMNTRLDMKERQTPVSRFDKRNVNYNARSNRNAIEKRTSENRDENRLLNRRHEERKARDERQTKMTREDTSIVMRGLVTLRNDPQHNERPAAVHKLYENLVFEMQWQYLFYALQAVYICSLIMKIPKCNEQNKHTMWIPTWFTLNEYLKID